jgi:hypothetical protein
VDAVDAVEVGLLEVEGPEQATPRKRRPRRGRVLCTA